MTERPKMHARVADAAIIPSGWKPGMPLPAGDVVEAPAAPLHCPRMIATGVCGMCQNGAIWSFEDHKHISVKWFSHFKPHQTFNKRRQPRAEVRARAAIEGSQRLTSEEREDIGQRLAIASSIARRKRRS